MAQVAPLKCPVKEPAGMSTQKEDMPALAYPHAREERLELPTPGFGDQCSTN